MCMRSMLRYEFDQVMQNADGTESQVPITWSYNHHYSARVVGKYVMPHHALHHRHLLKARKPRGKAEPPNRSRIQC